MLLLLVVAEAVGHNNIYGVDLSQALDAVLDLICCCCRRLHWLADFVVVVVCLFVCLFI